MEGFVREAALSLSEREWQIVEIREMSSLDGKRYRIDSLWESLLFG